MAVDSTKRVSGPKFGWDHYTHQQTKSVNVGTSFGGASVSSIEAADIKAGELVINDAGVLKRLAAAYGFDNLGSATSGTAPLTADYVYASNNGIVIRYTGASTGTYKKDTFYKVVNNSGTYSASAIASIADLPGLVARAKGICAEDYKNGANLLVAFELSSRDADNIVVE